MSDDYTLNLQQLAEMFPDMDREVVDIVLRDSAGLLEPATNVLLSMNDLEFKPEEEKAVQLDAEYARRLAETEIAARGGRARSASASVGRRGPTPPPAHHLTPPTAPAVPASSSSSKIRSMLRFGRRSGSNNTRQSPSAPGGGSPLGSVPGSAPSSPLRVGNNPDALESDFSDASESGPSHREGTPPPPPPPVQQQTDLIGLLDDSSPDLASSYVPLSPSKLTHKPVAPIASVNEEDIVDMNNPFAVQFDPLAVVADPLADMSLASVDESSDTNPFRARRHVGPPS
ncbi:hypothetical protein H4R27_004087 [Coemansia aciculifera]|nr:hypothetical protein H4R27_004087 [Coemansia aciculifera]